eukprot:TRINITY_DN20574_c0_g2_i2.p2 TRINITY_DN20574_c0_g2~~TRINITY_DN20574_c0_g2_i2.p2  ORF type:complete len:101 (-),score=31.03 TRINITY_DN20574_c0_g2_i2:36-338(-)
MSEEDMGKGMSPVKHFAQEVGSEKVFVIEGYSDDEIKEIISIFKNDFKAPKNLWIENRFTDTIILEDELAQEIPGNTEAHVLCVDTVSYTHLTLPTKRIV